MPDGLVRDKTVEMALPVMIGTDGRRALPAFTSVAALAAWDPAARPVPVPAHRAAQGAVQEGCAFLVVDPAGPGDLGRRPGPGRIAGRPAPLTGSQLTTSGRSGVASRRRARVLKRRRQGAERFAMRAGVAEGASRARWSWRGQTVRRTSGDWPVRGARW